jgi:hypothetical protein
MSKVVFEYEGQVSAGLNSWDRDSQKRVTVELNDDDLSVNEMLEEFMNFMQAIGYKFDIGDRFEVVNDLKTQPTQANVDDYKIDFSKLDFSKHDPIVDDGGNVIGTVEKAQYTPTAVELDAEVARIRSMTMGLSEEALEMAAWNNLANKGV